MSTQHINRSQHYTDEKIEHVEAQFQKACSSGQRLFQAKNREYDSAFKKYGLLGVIFEIMGVLNRLPPMTIWRPNNGLVNVGKLRDLFLDLHNFSNMALILLEDNNWDGRNPIFIEHDAEIHPEREDNVT